MNQAPTKPCTRWATRLAARHPSDLSSAEHAELQAHLKTCPSCASASTDYALMETLIRGLPPVAPLAVAEFTPEEDAHAEPSTYAPQPILLSNYTSRRQPPQPPRRTRLVQRANMLAAVLVVALLIASVAVLYIRHPGALIGSSSQKKLPPVSCTEEKSLGDPVLIQLCQNRMLVDIHQSQVIGGYTITLQRAYVDANRLIFEYTARQNSTGKVVELSQPTLDVTVQHTSLGGPKGVSYNEIGANLISVPNKGAFPQNLRTLSLHVTMRKFAVGISTGPNNQLPTLQGNADFHFALPFHSGQTLNLHDTITLNGTDYTLYRLIVSPSMTSFYVTGILSDKLSTFSLQWRGQPIAIGDSTVSVPDVIAPNQPPYTVFSLETAQPFNQHGSLTLIVSVYADAAETQTTSDCWIVNI